MARASSIKLRTHIPKEDIDNIDAFFSNLTFAITDTDMFPDIVKDAVNDIYRKKVVEFAPSNDTEMMYRYYPQVFRNQGIDETRYIRGPEQHSLREAIGYERAWIVANDKNKFKVAFGSRNRINKRTIFGWKYRIRSGGKTPTYTIRWLNPENVDTLEKFEYGGTWMITPRPIEGGEVGTHKLHPYPAPIRFRKGMTSDLNGYDLLIKTVPAFGMFSKALSHTRKSMIEYIKNRLLEVDLSNP